MFLREKLKKRKRKLSFLYCQGIGQGRLEEVNFLSDGLASC